MAVAGGGECDGPARRSGAAAADESRVAIAASKHTDGRTPDQMRHGWAHGSASGSGKWNSGTAGISGFDGRSTSVPRQPRLRTAAGAPLGTEVARVLALALAPASGTGRCAAGTPLRPWAPPPPPASAPRCSWRRTRAAARRGGQGRKGDTLDLDAILDIDGGNGKLLIFVSCSLDM